MRFDTTKVAVVVGGLTNYLSPGSFLVFPSDSRVPLYLDGPSDEGIEFEGAGNYRPSHGFAEFETLCDEAINSGSATGMMFDCLRLYVLNNFKLSSKEAEDFWKKAVESQDWGDNDFVLNFDSKLISQAYPKFGTMPWTIYPLKPMTRIMLCCNALDIYATINVDKLLIQLSSAGHKATLASDTWEIPGRQTNQEPSYDAIKIESPNGKVSFVSLFFVLRIALEFLEPRAILGATMNEAHASTDPFTDVQGAMDERHVWD